MTTKPKRKIIRTSILIFILSLINSSVFALIQTATGFYLPGNQWSSDSPYLKFKEINTHWADKCHLGIDYKLKEDVDVVYAVTDGLVEQSNSNASGYGGINADGTRLNGGVVVIKHRIASGNSFYAVYGHIKNIQVTKGQTVTAGSRIGDIGPYYSWSNYVPHLHFGINEKSPLTDGYTSTKGCADSQDYKGFVDPEKYLVNNSPWPNPEFHGSGSLISPSKICIGCNQDVDMIHSGEKSGLALFQWRFDPNYCDHINISVENMSYSKSVEIRTGPWDDRTADKVYTGMLPISIEHHPGNIFNVTAIQFEKSDTPKKIRAICEVGALIGSKTEIKNSQPNGILLSNGWYWQGNGSIISDIAIPASEIGITYDVVKLKGPKGAAFFQWKKSFTCQQLYIQSQVSGNFKIRLREWNTSANPIASDFQKIIASRDIALSSDFKQPFTFIELNNTYVNHYYLISIYSDQKISANQINSINVKCPP